MTQWAGHDNEPPLEAERPAGRGVECGGLNSIPMGTPLPAVAAEWGMVLFAGVTPAPGPNLGAVASWGVGITAGGQHRPSGADGYIYLNEYVGSG